MKNLAQALDAKIKLGYPIHYVLVDIDRHDWMQVIAPFDIVIWFGSYTTPAYAAHYKEKIYFIERHLGKLVVPNFETVWTFESKVAKLRLRQGWLSTS